MVNGRDVDENHRGSALYFSTTLGTTNPSSYSSSTDRGGWLELEYGDGGNVVSMTVHAACHDASDANRCYNGAGGTATLDDRRDFLDDRDTSNSTPQHCVCTDEQHYQYR